MTYLWTAMKSSTWQMMPTEKIGTRKYTYSGTRYAEMTIQATSIITSHSAIARTPNECSTQQQHRLTWQQAIFEQNATSFLQFSFTSLQKWWISLRGRYKAKRKAWITVLFCANALITQSRKLCPIAQGGNLWYSRRNLEN